MFQVALHVGPCVTLWFPSLAGIRDLSVRPCFAWCLLTLVDRRCTVGGESVPSRISQSPALELCTFLLKVETMWSAERRGSTGRQTLSPTMAIAVRTPAQCSCCIPFGKPDPETWDQARDGTHDRSHNICGNIILFLATYGVDRLLSMAWPCLLQSPDSHAACCTRHGLSISYHITQYQQPVVWDG